MSALFPAKWQKLGIEKILFSRTFFQEVREKKRNGKNNEEGGVEGSSAGTRNSAGSGKEGTSKMLPRAEGLLLGLQAGGLGLQAGGLALHSRSNPQGPPSSENQGRSYCGLISHALLCTLALWCIGWPWWSREYVKKLKFAVMVYHWTTPCLYPQHGVV